MEDKKLTVVQILPELEEGGVEGETVDLAVYLSQQGHRSIVISAGGRLVQLLEKHGCEHVCWPHIGEKSIRCLKYIKPLMKYLVDEDVDVLHLRSRLPAWVSYFSWKLLPKEKRPALITSFHGFYSVNAYSTIMTKGERVVAVSQTIKDHILKNYKVSRNKIDLIHGGYDETYFSPDNVSDERVNVLRKKWKLPDGIPVILLPGRLTSLKGQEFFLESLPLIAGYDFRVLLVGDVDENSSYTRRLREKIRKSNLEEQVILTGHCSDMPAALKLSDFVVSASSSQPEAFGKVSIEAMAMKKLVVATSHGGSLETVLDSETGYLVPPFDTKKMAQALRKALTDMDRTRKMGEAGHHWVKKKFTARRMCEKSIELYEKILEEKKRKKAGKRLTVVQMLPELEGGGVERGTLEMGKYLAKNGHQSIVISAGGRMVKQLEEENSQHVSYHVGSKSPKVFLYFWPLRRLLQNEDVDVLHLRSRMPAWLGYLAWKSLPKKKRPVLVTTFHGFYSVNGYSAIMTMGMGIIAVSRSIKQHILSNYTVKNEVKLIFRGVDEDHFNPEKIDVQRIENLRKNWNINQAKVVLLPARITRLKGQDVFIKAVSMLKEIPFQAVLVGDPNENPRLMEELKQLVKEHQLEEKVIFAGHCDDMAAAYCLADLVVSSSSREPEAFGRTIVEAMAMGKPVVATAHGGSLETVVPGVTGWLVLPRSPEEMARAIERFFLLSEKDKKMMGLAGQERVRKMYTTRSMCQETMDFYKKLLRLRERNVSSLR